MGPGRPRIARTCHHGLARTPAQALFPGDVRQGARLEQKAAGEGTGASAEGTGAPSHWDVSVAVNAHRTP